MGYMLRKFGNNGGNSQDVDEYKKAGKHAKSGISMVMEGLERGDKAMIMEGAEKAWNGVKTMCEISKEMEEQFGERRNNEFRMGDTWNNRGHEDWNDRDDEWMERRMRDIRGRYM